MIPLIQEYPVFEADQVLSQKHLNKLIAYLEEQDRLSRTSLIGMGVVCGLEIDKPNSNSVIINCGTAITSLGFLIPFETTRYTHFKETTLSEEFLKPDTDKHEYLQGVYDYSKIYEPFENVLELVKAGALDDGKKPLTSNVLNDKVIMLLIEAPLIDEKNCVAVDCADKGKRLQFKVRPLLVDRETLEDSDIALNECLHRSQETIKTPKYNVPATTLRTGQIVLDAFNGQINKIKRHIGTGIQSIHKHFEFQFEGLSNYNSLSNAVNRINAVHNEFQDDIYIQYVMDWINDLVATYNEIGRFIECNPSVCCPDQGIFPFHVLLGMAEFETRDIQDQTELSRFRTPFIKTGALYEEEKKKQIELETLIKRLIHLLNNFDLNLDVVLKEGIKITPSFLGAEELGIRSIPFYYDKIKNLNKKWSYDLSSKGKNLEILSYHAKEYNTDDEHVVEPLIYDCEATDFYRIEGHIGQRFDKATADILAIKSKFRLPFKVLALNVSDYTRRSVDISKHTGDWGDMELDYDMSKRKVLKITQSVINWINFRKADIIKETLMNEASINSLKDILTQVTDFLPENLQEYLGVHDDFTRVFNNLNFLFMLHRFCLWRGNRDNSFSDLAEDLIDHFDEINSLFLEDPFTVLFDEAHRRWEDAYKDLFFSKFAEDHPGIEHKGGVPKGGTFVMAYVDSSIFATPKPKGTRVEGLITKMTDYKKIFKVGEEKETEIFKSLQKTRGKKKRRARIRRPQVECKEDVEKVKGYVMDSIKKDMESNMSSSVKDYLLVNIGKYFDQNVEEVEQDGNVPEKVIIADFYLPYICCAQGAGINILIPSAEVQENTLADFLTEDFNDNDFFTNI